MINYRRLLLILVFILTFSMNAYAQNKYFNNKDVDAYIKSVSKEYKIPEKKLRAYFDDAKYIKNSITLMDKPAETFSWKQYLERVLSQARIDAGALYYRKYNRDMQNASKKYGVPPHIIAGVIGIETTYGKAPLRYRAFDVLATLAFHYPRRAKYFKSELTALIVYAEKTKTNPFSYKSSYAGAIGIPQFMPSNVKAYAVTATNKKPDIVSSHADAIHSVANYLKRHGWKTGEPVLVKVRVKGNTYKKIFSEKPCSTTHRTVTELKKMGIVFPTSIKVPPKAKGALTELDGDFYITFTNFCSIMRYNPSPKYAMSVTKLGLYLISAEQKLKKSRG